MPFVKGSGTMHVGWTNDTSYNYDVRGLCSKSIAIFTRTRRKKHNNRNAVIRPPQERISQQSDPIDHVEEA